MKKKQNSYFTLSAKLNDFFLFKQKFDTIVETDT